MSHQVRTRRIGNYWLTTLAEQETAARNLIAVVAGIIAQRKQR